MTDQAFTSLSQTETEVLVDTITSLTSVKRFHGHPVINPQSVADHSARVGMLAYSLALEYYQDISKANRVCTFALFHDFTEGLLRSDVNSAIKQQFGIREILKKLEEHTVSKVFNSGTVMSNQLSDLFLEKCSTQDYVLLKVADTLDFGLYLHDEIMLGNKHMHTLLYKSFLLEYERYPIEFRELQVAKQAVTTIFSAVG